MKKFFFLTIALNIFFIVNGQNVGIGTSTPASSAQLELYSNSKGFLPPRMTEAERNAIQEPSLGLVIFNTSTNCLNIFVGVSWREFCGNISYPVGTINCLPTQTTINDVINPITGRIWMDRNLGATRVATNSTDNNAYGDLFQWGRRADGHQCRNSTTIASVSTIDQPTHDSFILATNSPFDWRNPQNNNLWQGVNGINNPCPSGYRLPTSSELNAERVTWSINNSSGAFASPLKLTVGGFRDRNSGSVTDVGFSGFYWSSTVNDASAQRFYFLNNDAQIISSNRAFGGSIRCIKEIFQGTITSINCISAINMGTLNAGEAASGVSCSIPYSGGNGGNHNGQMVNSTGVLGLTATLLPGSFENGTGNLNYTITGTPASNGTANFAINIGGQTCNLTRTVNLLGTIASLNCAGATNTGTLKQGISADNVFSIITYTGGNGGPFNSLAINSTGVIGLTATLTNGNFANGIGILTFNISGTPGNSGIANFAISIGGQTCTLNLTVNSQSPSYPVGTIHCTPSPTAVIDVTNPATGKIWMDRNLGASRVATSSTDPDAYGDLYQWGRRADGHQCRNSPTTTTLSSTDQPTHGNFILVNSGYKDWRSPQNANLWQGVNGVNNPCPIGYRLPSDSELIAERASWSINGPEGAFASPLKLPMAGYRFYGQGLINDAGTGIYYWSSTASNNNSNHTNNNNNASNERGYGFSVRCIKN